MRSSAVLLKKRAEAAEAALEASPLFETTLVAVRFYHVASRIVNANHSTM